MRFLSVKVSSWSSRPGPYSTMRGFGSLVCESEVVSTFGTPPCSRVASNFTEMVRSPASPSWTTLTSPGASSGLGRMMVSKPVCMVQVISSDALEGWVPMTTTSLTGALVWDHSPARFCTSAPGSPFFSTLYVPCGTVSSYLYSTSNGTSRVGASLMLIGAVTVSCEPSS